jgi:transcriptional regulator with XRE-family HTH domain
MHMISAAQIRAARALLGWSQNYLADAANLSRATIQTIENGFSVRTGKIESVRQALRDHGIEFLDGDGVRRQPEGLKDFMGTYSCDRFFDDVLKTVKEQGCDLICLIYSQDMLTKVSGMTTRRANLERLDQVQKITNIKCILSDDIMPPLSPPSFEVRVLPEEPTIVPTSIFAYGDQLVFGYQDDKMHFAFVAFQRISFRRHYQSYFLPRWNIAKPLLIPAKPKKLCA